MASGYYQSPWPAEDAGAQRLQTPVSGSGLSIQEGEQLACITRNTLLSTMTVLGAPGEVFLLTHSALRAHVGLATTACVERIDPITLKTLESSGRLPGGPMWPGGMAVHKNGDLYVVYGRYAHRLNRHCQLQKSFAFGTDQAHNSFVILDNGLLVSKNLSDKTPAHLTVLDPTTLSPACPVLVCKEPSIARLSAIGNTVYVVGIKSIFRYHWLAEQSRLVLDEQWAFDYTSANIQTYGWDVVLDGTHAWFMDNGRHDYKIKMIGAGLNPTANRLIRVSMAEPQDHQALPISGLPYGSITNPPIIDKSRGIVVAYDSANKFLKAWQFDMATRVLTPLWHKRNFACASHMILYPDTGELVINDYRRWGEEVVVLHIETGLEKGRVRTGGITQGVVFPSAGWNRDFYWSSMGRLARVFLH